MEKTLLIDNYDSFTYNLFALIAETSGAAPTVLRNDELDWQSVAARGFDRIVISPGPGRPQCAADLGLSADAILSCDVPVLGVCLGHQAIGHFFGARVALANEPVHGRCSPIEHAGSDLFQDIPSPFQAVRYHSLAVTDLPAELQAIAWSEDGTVMALRHRSRPLWGVQFHPESIRSEYGAAIMRRFFELSAAAVRAKPASLSVARSAATRMSRQPASSLRVHVVRSDVRVEPSEVFQALYGDSEGAFWLDSAELAVDNKKFSYMGDTAGPRAEVIRYHCLDRRLEIIRREQHSIRLEADLFSYLEQRIEALRPVMAELPFDFTGGYVGYFGYELGARPGSEPTAPSETPDALWIFADRVVVFDHSAGAVWLMCIDESESPDAQTRGWFERTQRRLEALQSDARRDQAQSVQRGSCDLTWRDAPESYVASIASAMQLIREGESYEVCLTNQLVGTCTVEPLEIYKALRKLNPAPYAAYLRYRGLAVLCSSPELFLSISAAGMVESKPIKGTAPRAADPLEDERRAVELARSVKTTAENLMIVDLLRNDLNRVCEVGSVHVPSIFAVERYASVHQLVSTVRGRLRPEVSTIGCIRAAFPGGSMTGAPKIRTMAILQALEQGPRGIYSGSLGYLSIDGSAKLNIVIRTIVLHDQRISIGTGGAIVALSDPQDELDETRLKVGAILRTLQRCAARMELHESVEDVGSVQTTVAVS